MSPPEVLEAMISAVTEKRWDDILGFYCEADADSSLVDRLVPAGIDRDRFLDALTITVTDVTARLVSETEDRAEVAATAHLSFALREDVLRELVMLGFENRGETPDEATIDAKLEEARQQFAAGGTLDDVYPLVRENGVWLLCPSALTLPSPAPTAPPTPAPTVSPTPATTAVPGPSASSGAMPGVEGDSFQSLFYALNFSWDDHWHAVTASTPGDRQDSLTLSSDVSSLYVDTYPWEAGTESCVEETITAYEGDPAASDVTPARDPAGREMRGSNTGFMDTFGAVTLTYGSDETSADYGIYISCWTVYVGQPDSVARFILVAPIEAFEAEVAALEALFETMRI